ncbi:MAG: exodeoxyribonuclease VII small subunit [Lachnospiraceae bacterium]|nr:exodeoxyribonuclease VII small subunit [Lachnospiraceae bacterium]
MMEGKEKQAEESRSVEENFALLDDMIKKMESEDVTLEESFQLYQRGMQVLKEVGQTIDGYEKQIRILNGSGETEEME